MKETRKLNTILFADITGYTAIMHSDEEKAMEYLQSFKKILEEIVPDHDGRIVQYFGDACLLSFDSNTSGVQCAISLQHSFQDQNLPIRIGMHLGEVIFTDDNVFGDGVNIASRIESMGIPGSVLLSSAIRSQIKNKDEFKLISLGSFEFKNVAEAMEVFALQNEGLAIPEKSKIQGKFKEPAAKPNKILRYAGILALLVVVAFAVNYFSRLEVDPISEQAVKQGIVSIAVLPFADMSPLNDQEYFSDGLSEELLNVLAKVKHLKVAGRTSSFKYKGVNDDLKKIGSELGVDHILEGSVRKSGDNIRITAQLIKVEDGFHMWTETYDKVYSAESIFQIQDEISSEVLKELKVKLFGSDFAETKPLPTTNTAAYEAYLKGMQLSLNYQPKEIEIAIQYLDTAIMLDSKFSRAHSRLAINYSVLERYGSMSLEEATDAIMSNASKAILLDEWSGMANLAMAYSYGYQGKVPQALEILKTAYEIEPNNPEIILMYASFCVGEDSIQTELRKKAHSIDPLSPLTISRLSSDYYDNGLYAEAQDLAEKNVAINPDYVKAHSDLVSLLRDSPNGKLDEAFITAYRAHQEFPENLEVLTELAYAGIDLHLHDHVDELRGKMTLLYAENKDIGRVTCDNYFCQGDLENFIRIREEQLDILNFNHDETGWFTYRMENYYFSENLEEAIDYIQSYHPIYLSDTLTSIPGDRKRDLVHAAAILKHSGNDIQAKRLTEVFCSAVSSEFEFGGDLESEKLDVLYEYGVCACLSGDGELASEIFREIYFNRKSKASTYDGVLNNIMTNLIADSPEFKA